MSGGIKQTDPQKLADDCDSFRKGIEKLYPKSGGDMWFFFELYHHLIDCADALRSLPPPTSPQGGIG